MSTTNDDDLRTIPPPRGPVPRVVKDADPARRSGLDGPGRELREAAAEEPVRRAAPPVRPVRPAAGPLEWD
ncbi:MAG: hypothetical protein ACYC61_28230, partial [Isosphaeraceae bacterium]